MKNVLVKSALALIFTFTQSNVISADASKTLPETDISATHQHQRELVGKRSIASALGYSLLLPDTSITVSRLVHEITRKNLPKDQKHLAAKISRAIIREANRNEMDPLFLAAVIRQESKFNPKALGGVGEIGLMQIRPCTAAEIAEQLGLKNWNLADPATNIRFGAYYFSKLRGKFDRHAQLYVSAYNMGPRNVTRLLEKDKKPKEYASKVMEHYNDYLKNLDQVLLNKKSRKVARN